MATQTIKVKMIKCTCERCGHARKAEIKRLCCSKCKSPYWDRKKKTA